MGKWISSCENENKEFTKKFNEWNLLKQNHKDVHKKFKNMLVKMLIKENQILRKNSK